MRALQMMHTIDPKVEIMSRVKDHLPGVKVLGADLLMAIYVRPEKTASGIYVADVTRKEDIYQGKVGLVLALGPLAFVEDETHKFGGVVPKVGDWIAVRVGDTFQLSLGQQACRLVQDVNVRAILDAPDTLL